MVQIQIDKSQVERLLQVTIPQAQFQSLQRSAQVIKQVATIIIAGVFVEAIEHAGSAWPYQYTSTLMDAVKVLPVNVLAAGMSLSIDVDLDALGTSDDLEKGYHAFAAMEGGGTVYLPYVGQPLASDFDARYDYWTEVVLANPKKWDATMDARTNAWWDLGGKAPQWLILEYGTPWEPVIAPFPVSELIESRLAADAEAISAQLMNAAIQAVGGGGRIPLASDVRLELRGRGSIYASPITGQFIKNPYGD